MSKNSKLGPLQANQSQSPDDRGNTGLPPEAVALLQTIAATESAGSYNVIYGGQTFNSYDDHPKVAVKIKSGPNKGKVSTAAGKYQMIAPTWEGAKTALGLKDFSPASQDKAAWYIATTEYKADTGRDLLSDLKAGGAANMRRIASSLRNQWTSLPGGIEQGQNTAQFRTLYDSALGGKLGYPVPPAGVGDGGAAVRAGVQATGAATGYNPLPSPSPLRPWLTPLPSILSSIGGRASAGSTKPAPLAAGPGAVPAVSVAETRAEQAAARSAATALTVSAAPSAVRNGQGAAGGALPASGATKVGKTEYVSPDGSVRTVSTAGVTALPPDYHPKVDVPAEPATKTVTYDAPNPAWDVWNRTYGQSALTASTAPKGGMSALAGVGAAAGVAKLGSMSSLAGVGGGVVPKAPPRTIPVTKTIQVADSAAAAQARLEAARQAQLIAAQNQALALARAKQQAARSAANAAAPGTTFLQDRGVNTSNMSAGQQANALRDALGGSHNGSFN